MSILETRTGIVLFNPNKVKMGIRSDEIMAAYESSEMIKELIAKNEWVGTIQNPIDQFNMGTFLSIDPRAVAFKIKNIWKMKEKIFGDIEILDTEAGRHLYKFFKMMVFVPRALGHKEENKCMLITFDVRPDVAKAQVESEDTDGVQE